MGLKKVSHGSFPRHSRQEKELVSYQWCFKNNIQVGVFPGWGDDFGVWFIEIRINGNKSVDPARYNYDNVMFKVYEYCDYYYNKYNKDGK